MNLKPGNSKAMESSKEMITINYGINIQYLKNIRTHIHPICTHRHSLTNKVKVKVKLGTYTMLCIAAVLISVSVVLGACGK